LWPAWPPPSAADAATPEPRAPRLFTPVLQPSSLPQPAMRSLLLLLLGLPIPIVILIALFVR
jgi:hypothetical protein